MCLSIAVNLPDHVLNRGEHDDYEWIVTHNGIGFRCGYVRVPKGHPWYGKYADTIGAEMHGGGTFAEADVPCANGGADDGWWIGFDCAHAHDAQDPALPAAVRINLPGQTVRTQEYVESQCRSLCEQAWCAAQEDIL